MKIDRNKFDLARARACMGPKELEKQPEFREGNIMHSFKRRKCETGNSWKTCQGSWRRRN